MARLPVVFSDRNTWGGTLLEFLRVVHNENGTLKTSEVLGGFTSTRVPFANASGILTDSALFTFNSSTGVVSATGFAGAHTGTFSGTVTITGGTITGTSITTSSATITGGTITGITDLALADGGTGASDAAGARTNLGLGTIATQNANNVTISGGAITGITDLAVADGGTAASTAAGARTNLAAAPLDPSFLTLGTNAELSNERVLTAGTNITLTDAGAGSTLTVLAGPTTQTAQVRVSGTSYQPSTTKSTIVSVICTSDGASALDVVITSDAANPPTTVVAKTSEHVAATEVQTLTFVCLKSNFYKIVQTAPGTIVTMEWN